MNAAHMYFLCLLVAFRSRPL